MAAEIFLNFYAFKDSVSGFMFQISGIFFVLLQVSYSMFLFLPDLCCFMLQVFVENLYLFHVSDCEILRQTFGLSINI